MPVPTIQSAASLLFSIVILLLPILIKQLYPQLSAWLEAQARQVKAHLTAAQWQLVSMLAHDVVAQVEQGKKTGLIPSNDAALKWACQRLHELLILRGIDLPLDNLVTVIESAVHELTHKAAQ